MNVTEFLNERGLFYTDIIGKESKMELIKCIEDYAKLYHESELKKERQIQLKQMLDDLDEDGVYLGTLTKGSKDRYK